MNRQTVFRRLLTIPVTIVMFALVTVTLPALVLVGGLVDLVRGLSTAKPAMATRLVSFLWVYLTGEMWALMGMLLTWPLSRQRKLDLTFRLQGLWTSWNFNAMRAIFGLKFSVTGSEQIPPAPILVLARHASMVDTMLPARLVTRSHGIRLRYVLKKELLLDPVLDIGGNRLPNHFVDRRIALADPELAAIRDLAGGMGPGEGMLIYPEGTRFSEQKRDRYVARIVRRGGRLAEIADSFATVLPPKPGGALALLEATIADVVVLAHRGLEGFARVKDIWSGGLVGSTIDVHFWRLPRSSIPEDRSARVEWLFEVWADVDAWVAGKRFAR
ncbi:MAG: lysophospholipid acyltransferase family protein [Acidimicrobiia bacterium]